MKSVRTIESITLDEGPHDESEDGMCVMEAVAYFAGEKHSDYPECASDVIAGYCQIGNDNGGTEFRERLKPYIYKIIGTASPELDVARLDIALSYGLNVFLPTALRGCNLNELARTFESCTSLDLGREALSVTPFYPNGGASALERMSYAFDDCCNMSIRAKQISLVWSSALNSVAMDPRKRSKLNDQWFACLDEMLWPQPEGK